MSQHDSLTLERWLQFDRDQQLLMIANEMHRGTKLRGPEGARRCYERVLRLTDLTVQAAERATFRRELLRWRDLVAELWLRDEPDRQRHLEALRCLLLFSPETARQRPWILR